MPPTAVPRGHVDRGDDLGGRPVASSAETPRLLPSDAPRSRPAVPCDRVDAGTTAVVPWPRPRRWPSASPPSPTAAACAEATSSA